MHLEYQVTPEEFKDCNYYTSWSSPEKRNARIKYYIINLALYLFSVTVIVLIGKKPLRLSGIIIFALFAILTFIYLKWRVRRQIDRYVDQVIKESGEDRIFSRVELDITERGIHERSKDSETSYQWSAILKRVEANNCCYLYLNSRLVIVIPKRVFNSTQQKEEFDKMMLQYLPLSADLPQVFNK